MTSSEPWASTYSILESSQPAATLLGFGRSKNRLSAPTLTLAMSGLRPSDASSAVETR
jgi:hypothetical protein